MELQQMKTKEIEQLLQQTTSDDISALLELLLLDQRHSVQTMAQRYQKAGTAGTGEAASGCYAAI